MEQRTASSSQIFNYPWIMMRRPASSVEPLLKVVLQITFDFTNIGSVLGAAVSLIGSFAIDFGRGLIVDGVKKVWMKWRRIFSVYEVERVCFDYERSLKEGLFRL